MTHTTDTSISDIEPIEREELSKKIAQLDRYIAKVNKRVQFLSLDATSISTSIISKIHDYSQRQEPEKGGYSHEC
jgi:hypothetical protein